MGRLLRAGFVVVLLTALAVPVSAGPLTPLPEVCDQVDGADAACLPVRVLNAILFPITPDGPVEQWYAEPGPWTPVHDAAFACCDSAGNAYDVYRPRFLGLAGRHPVITWGNGTGAQPSQYDTLLKHFASWGFVVVATREDATGSGTEILDAAEFIVAQDADPASIFFGKLDTASVGAMGHSQGAAGVVAAMNASDGLIATAIPFHMPNPYGCGSPPGSAAQACRDLYSAIGPGSSVFFVTGSFDFPISTPAGNTEYYDLVGDGIPKARGTIEGTSHNDIQGGPGCRLVPPSVGCFNGVHAYLGYPVAWMMDRLTGDGFARTAFVADGELFTNAHWSNQASDDID